MSTLNLSHHFLVATPLLQDIYFKKSVIYLCEHSDQGAMGVIINKTSGFSCGEIMQQLDMTPADDTLFSKPAFSGGPVDIDRGFVLHNDHRQQWKSTLDTGKGILLSSSLDILQAIAENRFPHKYLIGLGYSGWSEGQLEQELAQNAWLTCPASEEVIFMEDHEQKFAKSCEIIGMDWSQLASGVGHA